MGPKSSILREVTVPAFSNVQCNEEALYNGLITQNMICAAAEGKDSCHGDSGGPLIVSPQESSKAQGFEYCEDVQVGIVSWGIRCAALSGSGDSVAGFPGVYTRVANYHGWIKQTLDLWGVKPMAAPTLKQNGCLNSSPQKSPEPTSAATPLPTTRVVPVCGDLHKGFEKKQHLCTTSRTVDGKCMKAKQGYTFNQAVSLCASMGARLCSLDELRDGETKTSGCGINRMRIWTSAACSNGLFTAAFGGNGGNFTCTNIGVTMKANRCCAEPPKS
jgi:hypothetical protein